MMQPTVASAFCKATLPPASDFSNSDDADTFHKALSGYYNSHGCYSDAYNSPWNSLDTADILVPAALHYPDTLNTIHPKTGQGDYWYNVTGVDLSVKAGTNTTTWTDPFLHLKGLELEVDWDDESVTERSSWNKVINIHDVKYVLLEDLFIETADEHTKYTVSVDGCDTLIIRNSYFAGPAQKHINIRGCRRVFIDKVEIAGLDTNLDGLAEIGGISIENGTNKDVDTSSYCDQFQCSEAKDICENSEFGVFTYLSECPLIAGAVPTSTPSWILKNSDDTPLVDDEIEITDMTAELEWLGLQNIYIHDGEQGSGDGIAIESPSDGILFNSVIDGWLTDELDAALDIDHRRLCDTDYTKKTFRLERNMLLNASIIKTPGISADRNRLLFAVNLFLNMKVQDYHRQHVVGWVHNTWLYDENFEGNALFDLTEFYNGPPTGGAHSMEFINNFVYVDDVLETFKVFKHGGSDSNVVETHTTGSGLSYETGDDPREGDLLKHIRARNNAYITPPDIYFMYEAGSKTEYVQTDGVCSSSSASYPSSTSPALSFWTAYAATTDFGSSYQDSLHDNCFLEPLAVSAAQDFMLSSVCKPLRANLTASAFNVSQGFFGAPINATGKTPVVGAIQPGL
jgi:hypothetical protein